MPTYSAYITLDGLPVYDPVALARSLGRNNDRTVSGIPLQRVLGRCNSFTTQRGFLPGRGFVLMKAGDTLSLDLDATDHSLVFAADNTVTFSNLIITNIELVTGVEDFTQDALCRVDLADLRVLGPFTSINRAYNVGPYTGSGYYTATKNAGATWTYEGIVNDIWSLMPAAFASLITTGADFPTGIPENYTFRGVTAWDALQTILDDIHHILLLSPAGNFSVVKANNSDTLETTFTANKPYILSGSHDQNAVLHRVPATVRVFFPKSDPAWQNNTDLQVVTSKDHYLLNPLYSVDVATSTIFPALNPVAGTVHPIHDTLVAQYDELGVISNAADLSARATVVATNYIKGNRYADEDGLFTYSGAREFSPSHYIASVSYFDYGKGIQTSIRRAPRDQLTHPNLETRTLGGMSAHNYARENNSPPDITRASPQSERFVVVELYEDLEAEGDALANVQYGTNAAGSITWADTLSGHQIMVYNLTSSTYASGTRLIAWFHQQTRRWLALAPAESNASWWVTCGTRNHLPSAAPFTEELVDLTTEVDIGNYITLDAANDIITVDQDLPFGFLYLEGKMTATGVDRRQHGDILTTLQYRPNNVDPWVNSTCALSMRFFDTQVTSVSPNWSIRSSSMIPLVPSAAVGLAGSQFRAHFHGLWTNTSGTPSPPVFTTSDFRLIFFSHNSR